MEILNAIGAFMIAIGYVIINFFSGLPITSPFATDVASSSPALTATTTTN